MYVVLRLVSAVLKASALVYAIVGLVLFVSFLSSSRLLTIPINTATLIPGSPSWLTMLILSCLFISFLFFCLCLYGAGQAVDVLISIDQALFDLRVKRHLKLKEARVPTRKEELYMLPYN